MHDFELEHEHDDLSEADREAIARAIWEQDTLELTTVGIDIGSSTTHLLFARVTLTRQSLGLSSRFVVIDRQVISSVCPESTFSSLPDPASQIRTVVSRLVVTIFLPSGVNTAQETACSCPSSFMISACRYKGRCHAYLSTTTAATSCSVGIPFLIKRSGAGA